ncbi:hypothetical protein [Aeromicrobium sp. UC242_57]|uniref:hypothetical protein n=1 Tax=Aeromicrobium sp. UC242_57 TaxID=3374624 RepID=UPI0037AEBBE1
MLKIGDRLLPRHVLFSDDWVTKMTDVAEPWTNDEECAYIENFADEQLVDEAFRLAGLDYGRIDYGFVDGRLQVWEINTNPVVLQRREVVKPVRLQSQELSARPILAWLHELAAKAPTGPAVQLFGRAEALRWQSQVTAARMYDKRRK